ncbi:MAG: Pyruvate dehydrogenase E1 component [Herbaspirillum frisingense]|uniref:Pyruvate dehydrogenase E1 component n=1 Tax=Herbaspirillum frisingense TaxID=92645 RepID=A0A7V8JUA5_9BURK|nr:MAG: Pyruvate dehydrogenase E1 component [Herbaspirillum frisingense]
MSAHSVPMTQVASPTSLAALACQGRIAEVDLAMQAERTSPLRMARAIAHTLAASSAVDRLAWVVRADGDEALGEKALTSAWPLRFFGSSAHVEKPLIYLLRTDSMAGLRVAFQETNGRGIFLNTAETAPSRWLKGVKPELALWLADYPPCIPYDPATAEEARAIVQASLQALYVEGEEAYYYLNLHDDGSGPERAEPAGVEEAYTGMYLVRTAPAEASGRVRLCGAGKALERVIRAADMLLEDWGVASDIWSCPSYTRLARDGQLTEQWNTVHPLAARRTSRLAACLGEAHTPIIAVTDYEQHVAAQIGAYVAAPFSAIGADSLGTAAGRPGAEWIVMLALKALAADGRVSAGRVGEALRRYGHRLHGRLEWE